TFGKRKGVTAMKRSRMGILIMAVAVVVGIWFTFNSWDDRNAGHGPKDQRTFPRDRRPNLNDCEEVWTTKMRLLNIRNTFAHFNQLADQRDKESLRHVRSVAELYSLLYKKTAVTYDGALVPTREDPNYL